MLHDNLLSLRKLHRLTQEELAERIGVTRQAVAKWENGETLPDIEKCRLLASIYNVSLDDLVNYQASNGLPIGPRGKHIFGVVTVGEKGQIVIPQKARKIFNIQPGDRLVVLGDESQGLAMIPEMGITEIWNAFRNHRKEETE